MNFVKNLACVLVLFVIDPCEVDAVFNGLRVISPHTYPSIGWIMSSNSVNCGAVLVSTNKALTAASCVTGGIDFVYFGDHVRSDTDGREQVFSVSSTITHPNYNSATDEYDVAILNLNGTATVTDYVQSIPLLTNDHLTDRILGKHCRVVGWGDLSIGSTLMSDVPYEVTVDNTTCTDAGPPTSTAICYEPFRDSSALACQGDTGGAFLCKRKRVWTLAGIMSTWNVGTGCTSGSRAATTIPTVYDWVSSNL